MLNLHREFTKTSPEFYSQTEIWPVIGSIKKEVSTKLFAYSPRVSDPSYQLTDIVAF